MDLNNIPPSAYTIGASALFSGGVYMKLNKKINKLKGRINELEEELEVQNKKNSEKMLNLETQISELRRTIENAKEIAYIPKTKVERPYQTQEDQTRQTIFKTEKTYEQEDKLQHQETEEEKIARLMSD